MDTIVIDLKPNEAISLPIAEVIGEESGLERKDAPEFAALGTSLVALATSQATIEYTTDADVCQAAPIPTFDEIEALIASAARKRIESAYRDVEDTRARLGRERTARELALQSAQERANQTKASLAALEGERGTMERRSQAFLQGAELEAVLDKIHLAVNTRQWELENRLKAAEAEIAEAQLQAQAAGVTDALELQLAQQELERLETAAPEVAETVRLTATAVEKLATAAQAVEEGMLKDAAVLLDQAKAGHADSERVAEVERSLAEARQAKRVRDLIARLSATPDRPSAVRRIHRLMDEAYAAGVSDQVAAFASEALDIAREAANARFAQARPIADHLASEGFVPVVGDGRIEAWKQVARHSASLHAPRGTVWTLDRILSLRSTGEWITEMPRNPITQKDVPMRVRQSRWFHPTGERLAP